MTSRTKHVVGMIAGLGLQLSLPLAYFGYWAGMSGARTALAAPGGREPNAFFHAIDFVRHSLVAGCIGTLIGVIMFAWSNIAYRRAIRSDSDMPSA